MTLEILLTTNAKEMDKMEYSAGNVSNLLWFVEMRETAKLLQNYDVKEVQRMVLDDNIHCMHFPGHRAENGLTWTER